MDTERRQQYRVVYPADAPKIVIDGDFYQVYDLSENGIRIFPRPFRFFGRGQSIAGTLIFSDGYSLPIEGHIIRVQPKQIAIFLVNKIPFAKILSEQARLRKLYHLDIDEEG